MDLVLRGGTVVDANGSRIADVHLAEGRIVRVGEVPDTGQPALSARGRYVTPGLVDCHIHLCYEGGPDPRVMTTKSDARLAVEAAAHARATLLAGVTTARDCGGRGFVETLVRDAIRAGGIEGPRLFTAGHPIVRRGGHMSYFGRETDGPEECRAAAEEQIRAGVDWLKVAATGGVTTPNVDPRVAELTEDAIRAVVEAGRAAGVAVAAHAHGGDGIRNALGAGVRSLEHGTFVDEAMIRTMVRDDVFLVPTMVATRAMIEAGTARGVPEYAVRKAEGIDGERRKAFAACVARGVKIAMGTDAGTPFNPHGQNAREVELMVEAGMTAEQALAAATTVGASMLGIGDRVGLVQEGHAGDILVLGRNPLDDASAFRRDLWAVVLGGRLIRSG